MALRRVRDAGALIGQPAYETHDGEFQVYRDFDDDEERDLWFVDERVNDGWETTGRSFSTLREARSYVDGKPA